MKGEVEYWECRPWPSECYDQVDCSVEGTFLHSHYFIPVILCAEYYSQKSQTSTQNSGSVSIYSGSSPGQLPSEFGSWKINENGICDIEIFENISCFVQEMHVLNLLKMKMWKTKKVEVCAHQKKVSDLTYFFLNLGPDDELFGHFHQEKKNDNIKKKKKVVGSDDKGCKKFQGLKNKF